MSKVLGRLTHSNSVQIFFIQETSQWIITFILSFPLPSYRQRPSFVEQNIFSYLSRLRTLGVSDQNNSFAFLAFGLEWFGFPMLVGKGYVFKLFFDFLVPSPNQMLIDLFLIFPVILLIIMVQVEYFGGKTLID